MTVQETTSDEPVIATLLIDMSLLFREGLKILLRNSQFVICGEAASIEKARDLEPTIPDVKLILINIGMGGTVGGGIEELKALFPDARIVVLTEELNMSDLTTAFEAGADGYLLQDLTPEALTQSLRLVILGEKVLPTRLAQVLVGDMGNSYRVTRATSVVGLSDREAQILRCLVNGDPNKVIANRLNITEGTVKVHLKGMLKKINVSNRTQAAIWALHHGFQSVIDETDQVAAG